MDEEEDVVLRKLRPHLPEHNDDHRVAEDMKKRKDQGLRTWKENDPYSIKRRTVVDVRFHTKEQQDFYETVLLDNSPVVSDMRYIDWKFIKENEDYFPHVLENFKAIDIDAFVGTEFTAWNDEMIM